MKKKCKVWLLLIAATIILLILRIIYVHPWYYFVTAMVALFTIKELIDYNPIKKINWQKSFIVYLVKSVISFCQLYSLHYIVICHYKKRDKQEPDWIAEFYVISFAVLITAGLFMMKNCDWIWNAIIWVAIYRLFDIMVKAGIIIFIDSKLIRNYNNKYIFLPTRNPVRWVILILINILEIMVCFAVLYFYWDKNINDSITAICQSIQTLTTLGDGHITDELKIIFIFQHVYYVIFVLLVAPRIFSLIRTKK